MSTAPHDSVDKPYDLAARGMYYLARMYDTQLSDLAEYSKLKKCYSVWLMLSPSSVKAKVLDYKMTNIGDYVPGMADKADYMELVMIYADPMYTTDRDIFTILQRLFEDSKKLEQFIPRNRENEKLYEEASSMCDIGDMREQRGVEKGIGKGIKKGIEKGIKILISAYLDMQVPTRTIIQKLQEKYDLTEEEAESKYLEYVTTQDK